MLTNDHLWVSVPVWGPSGEQLSSSTRPSQSLSIPSCGTLTVTIHVWVNNEINTDSDCTCLSKKKMK